MSSSEMRKSRASLIGAAIAALAAAMGLAACGGGGGGIEGGGESGEVETVKLEGKPSGTLTISNWPLYIDKETSPTSKRRPGSRSNTSRTSTRTKNSSPRCSRCCRKGNPAAAASSSSPTTSTAKCTSWATCRTSTNRRCRTSKRTCWRACGTRRSTPNRSYSVPWQSGMTGDHRQQRPGPECPLDLRPLRPASTRARSTCSTKSGKRCRW